MTWYLKKLNVRIDFIQIAIIDHVSFDLGSKEKISVRTIVLRFRTSSCVILFKLLAMRWIFVQWTSQIQLLHAL